MSSLIAKTEKIIVNVRLKDGVLDPQGVTIHKALTKLGYDDFISVRSGKFFELEVSGDAKDIDKKVSEVCSKLLTNPVIENYSVEKKS
ncbi:MAG: phosphoribosylformylglycinamidine synthase subunit PurS [candidate division Zixibacteria bacterium]|nr:phosphoribosylformylglycinamidine synthase subunit PurS [candidate division Zixibacteria bacterium]